MHTLSWFYLGCRQFPRELSPFEIRHFFSLGATDRRDLRVRYPKKLRLGAALQLGFIRMTAATLDAVEYVPRVVLQHLAHQLHIPAPDLATLRGLYRVERTLFAHQAWACAYARFHWAQASDRDAVIDALTEGSSGTLDRVRLAQQAREALHARRCLIPREREIEDWVRRAVHQVELEDRRQLDVAVSADAGERWLAVLMRERYPGPMTVLEWLRRPPRRRSRKTLEEELSKWLTIRVMSPPTNLERIPAQRLRSYARRMHRRRPIKVREIVEPRRTLELAAMLSVSAARQSDTVLRLIEMRISEIWSWAHAVAPTEPHEDWGPRNRWRAISTLRLL